MSHFSRISPKLNFYYTFMKDLYVSNGQICHMNIKINCQPGLGVVWDSLPPPTHSLELGQFFLIFFTCYRSVIDFDLVADNLNQNASAGA